MYWSSLLALSLQIRWKSLQTLGTNRTQQEWPSSFDGQKRNHTFNQPSEAWRLKIWLTNYSSPWAWAKNLKAQIVPLLSLMDLVTGGTFCLIAPRPLPLSKSCAHTEWHWARSHQPFPHGSTSCNGGFFTAHSQPSQLSRQIKQRPGPQIKHLFMAKREKSRWEGEKNQQRLT